MVVRIHQEDPFSVLTLLPTQTTINNTNSFPSSHLGEGTWLLTMEGRFESYDGSQFGGCHKGAALPCKLSVIGALPISSTNQWAASVVGGTIDLHSIRPDSSSGRSTNFPLFLKGYVR